MKLSKFLSGSVVILGSFLLVIFFQNCGQGGSVGVTGANGEILHGISDPDPAAYVPIPTAENNDLLNDNNDVTPPNNGNNGTPPTSHNGPPTSPDSLPPVDDTKPPTHDIPPVNDDSNPNEVIASCNGINIVSANLAVDVLSNSAKGSFAVLAPSGTLNLKPGKNIIRVVGISDDSNLKMLKVVLDLSQSYILGADNKTYAVIVPSSEQSGLKLLLDKKIQIKKDISYEIELDIDFETQLVNFHSGKACKFKPVIHKARAL